MVVFAGQGDARRSMDLLWRTEGDPPSQGGPGPRPALSVDAIVAAAVAIADTQGMAALSMRAVGERLGRTAMALYTYVPGKSELLDVMYDAVHAELPDPAGSGDWREDLTTWAGSALDFYVRHPWVLQISQARPVLGPHEYAALDTLVRLLYGTGLDPRLVRRLTGTLFHFVRGAAQTVADARRAAAATGRSDEEWWTDRAGLLAEVAPDFEDRFPHVSRLESESSPEPYQDQGTDTDTDADTDAGEHVPYLEREARRTFTTGLGVLLDGIAAAGAARTAPAR
ncbi:TetR/AcrR family transcriptional regulator C-terminal domain-containing protein [Streptomyces atroolivaceus]|uniref:TetR/AcrR family transcriptional regulator n=1 Tax=Streptomyces atroolivaceus TaxID=66869 RepID=UPI0033C8996C